MEITGTTRLTGLLGSPVKHSISPLMHNESFKQLNLDYVYLCFDVVEKNLAETVKGLRQLNVKGFNVTMPDKNLMCELVDVLSPASKMIGAVNTVVNENGILTGYTTDGTGYMRSLQEEDIDIIGKKMTIAGAGGASKAICVQAALDGVKEISIFNPKDAFFKNAEDLANTIMSNTACNVNVYDSADIKRLEKELSESAIFTNATVVGMSPNVDGCVIADKNILPEHIVVSDVIYNPLKTKLLLMAEERGCKAINGLDMLLYQGAEAFFLWTGEKMPVDIVKEKYFSK